MANYITDYKRYVIINYGNTYILRFFSYHVNIYGYSLHLFRIVRRGSEPLWPNQASALYLIGRRLPFRCQKRVATYAVRKNSSKLVRWCIWRGRNEISLVLLPPFLRGRAALPGRKKGASCPQACLNLGQREDDGARPPMSGSTRRKAGWASRHSESSRFRR